MKFFSYKKNFSTKRRFNQNRENLFRVESISQKHSKENENIFLKFSNVKILMAKEHLSELSEKNEVQELQR